MGFLYNFLVICLKIAAFPGFVCLFVLVYKIIEAIKLAYSILRDGEKVANKNIRLLDDNDDSYEYMETDVVDDNNSSSSILSESEKKEI